MVRVSDRFCLYHQVLRDESVMFDLSSSVAPFTQWVHDIWVEGPMGWWFRRDPQRIVRLSWNHLLHKTHGVRWMAILLDRSVASPSVLSLYINQPSSLSFFTFLLKSSIRAHLSSLLDRRGRPTILPVLVALLHPSCYFGEYFSPFT